MPNTFKERNLVGRFFYRFPSGESGADVYDRVSQPLLFLVCVSCVVCRVVCVCVVSCCDAK